MKKIIGLILITVALSFGYCEYGHKISEEYVGGHKEAVYDFGQGRILSWSFPMGASIPYQMRYDFYKGTVCY